LTWPTDSQVVAYHDSIAGTAIFDTILWNGPSGPEEMIQRWAQRRAAGPPPPDEALELAVIERSTERYVGGVSLRPVDANREVADIGYAFAPAVHGRGYATEAVGSLVDHAFAARGAERVFATIFVGNIASRRVIEKLGFLHEGTLRRVRKKRGSWIDEWLLAITRPDWDARRRE
jgi:RimJ/RimL family protein N-acetyltransferase